ncbi:hypothetical protein GCM10022252_19750 [Streptosporangium oxazolinicum]|uniref:Uncharacterized protein n=1 Tax=Streptosporangium oxazolinicum TaxID=909287 RepID=A0ABP8ANQ6_9ACTN
MDPNDLQARLQALAAQRANSPTSAPAPVPAPVPQPRYQPPTEIPQEPEPEWPTWVPQQLLSEEVEPPVVDADPFFEQYFTPQADPQTAMYEPFDQLDDLRDDQEEAGQVQITPSANAAYRAKRTALQGLIVSVLVAVGGVLTSLQLDAGVDWKLVAVSVGQAVLTALVSYLHNDNSAAASASE